MEIKIKLAIFIMIMALVLIIIATTLFVREVTTFFRLLGGISDKQSKEYNLPFSKNFKIELDDMLKENDTIQDKDEPK